MTGRGPEEDDDDRTQFAPLGAPGRPAAPETVETAAEKTPEAPVEAAVEAAAEESADADDITRFEPFPPPPAAGPGDDPATVPPLAAGPDATADPEDDRTQYGALPPRIPAPPAATGAEAGAPAVPEFGGEDEMTHPPVSSVPPQPLKRPLGGTALPAAGSVITIGTTINNNYEITQVLKAGGMGEVYRGREIGTGDPVAIKAILPELAEDEKAGQLFKREARTLRTLSDEAIVRYYNYLHDRDLDRYFLVMEFVEGVPLSDYIASHGAISVTSGLLLLKRLAKGLSNAHAQDVIHRDLSPDNVMLPDGVVEKARLIDFGIAKSNVMTEQTMHGQFAGKFKYVAPEQLGHYEGRITERTDIYGLALLLCAAVIGKPLDMGSSIFEAVQTRQTIPDLSAVPAELRPILSHMLEPNPQDRPASMSEVIHLLEDPKALPPKYLAGMTTLPPALERTGTGALPPITGRGPMIPVSPPPGLQIPGTIPAAVAAPGTTTLSPRGGITQTGPLPPEPEAPRRGGGLLIGGMVLAFALILGGAGYYAWTNNLLPIPGPGPNDTAAKETDTPAATRTAGIPDPVTSTREGFLAALDTGPCTFLSRVASGPNAGVLEGYSADGSSFAGVPTAYEEKFGARPSVLPRQIAQAQCAALDFTRGLQGRGIAAVETTLTSDALDSGGSIGGQIRATGGQSVWTALIAPDGAVYNLTGRLSDAVGGVRSLTFGLQLPPGAPEAAQLVLTVASDGPLPRAAIAKDGVAASDLLPKLLQDIAETGGKATAALSYVMLKPAAAAETPPAERTDP